MIQLTMPTIIVYGLLTATALCVWLPRSVNEVTRIPVWMIMFGISTLAGIYHNIVEPGGVLYLIWLGLCCHTIRFLEVDRIIKVAVGLIALLLVAGLFLHKIPLFNNPLVFDNFYFTDQSPAYKKYWNFDKAAGGVILLGYFGDVCRTAVDWKNLLRKSYGVALLTIAVSLLLAYIVGYIRLEVKFMAVYFLWAWASLVFTCVAEEMLFRGFIQKYLVKMYDNRTYQYAAVIFTGVLFGTAHFAGGAIYVFLATVAGVGYGFAYYLSGRIEGAILTHFILNSAHFLFFTYPYADSL